MRMLVKKWKLGGWITTPPDRIALLRTCLRLRSLRAPCGEKENNNRKWSHCWPETKIRPCPEIGTSSGCAIAARAFNPNCTIIGVEPEAGNDGQRSFRTGRIVHIDVPQTIADGAQTQHLGSHTFAVIRRLVDDVITVSDAEMVETMRFFASRMKLVVEPTGCLAAAAVFQKKVELTGRNVGILVSGGNIDVPRFAELLQLKPRE